MSDRVYPTRPFLAVSVAVFRDGKVLLARRVKAPGDGLFSLPGGGVELGENMEAAALRELAEETGVSARILGFNTHVEAIHRDPEGKVQGHFVVASYVAAWQTGEGTPGPEASEILWADPNALRGLPMTKGLPDVVRTAARIARESL
ncbi:NUDIX hydrolase [Methylovirgula sp. 4M-Z18]|uniref:NUDIX hydrolase n=1 Tax=Methylovirgula sp. 4M-Z18 TaxID=2293567 RepID=UPI001FE2225A|nr:NUDIX hydrolase [Methylovirgula sp. 4M-Z18]